MDDGRSDRVAGDEHAERLGGAGHADLRQPIIQVCGREVAEVLREHLELQREQEEEREKLGLYGRGAVRALSEILDALRSLDQYGSHQNLKTEAGLVNIGLVSIGRLREVVGEIVGAECPNLEDL